MILPDRKTFLAAWLVVCSAGVVVAQAPVAKKAAAAPADVHSLTVYPAKVTLNGPRAEQRLGVLVTSADGKTRELTREAKLTASPAAVVRIDSEGVVRPVKDGQAVITVQAAGQTSTVAVTVTNSAVDVPVSFSREIVPIMTKAGCNQGACHGSQHGRGGFKLSLLGYDPLFDYPQLVQSAEGRRVVLSDPERSILLQKPILAMEHGGGERFKLHAREYNMIKLWLEDGAPPPSAKDPDVTGLEVWPTRRIMVPGDRQQILVRASWQDGRSADVTASAQYNSLNEAVAGVDTSGRIAAKSQGETHIMIRFSGQASVVQVTLPFARLENYLDLPRHNFIDDKMAAKWKELGITPSPLCSDEEFFRRIHLDAIGTLPSPTDVRAFLNDPSKDKRQKAIDRVLNRPEFVDFWALKWGDLLRINREFLNERGMWSFHNWVRACMRDGKPVDEMVRDIITAQGSTFTEGPANYFMVARNPADWSENTAQVFLGVRLGCAKCHHHPFEKWSQDDYYGMAAFFTRLGTKGSQEFGIFGGEQVVFLKSAGEQGHPRKGGIVPPHPLDGPKMDDPLDRRIKLAEWMTAGNNPFFARNLTNRFWGYVMGRGLVEPLDDMRVTNPASNPELLDALAKDFVDHKFSLKHLLRTIMTSRAYQLSSLAGPGNEADAANAYYARYGVRRLTAEQLADALDSASGTQEKYPGLPLGTKAIQLPDAAVKSYLMEVFGRPPRRITCECERTAQPNIAQALHLLNGDFLNKKISAPTGRIEKLLSAKRPMPEMIEELYLVTVSRSPRADELGRAIQWVRRAPSEREGLQDLLWALLNSREFLFNH